MSKLSDSEIGSNRSNSHVPLENVDNERNGRLPFALTKAEVKLLAIAGVGFLLDAYDLFIINQVATMLQYRLYNGASLPAGLQGLLKAGANIGAVIGQFGFGYLADLLGRKAVYGKELILIMIATIVCISAPTNLLSPDNVLIWITITRIFLGIGIGGDYPMSASVMSDRAPVYKRGALLGYIFSNQGWGSLIGSIITMIVLLCYKYPMNTLGETSKVDGIWRIIIAVTLVPAGATLYHRLVLPDAERYVKSRNLESGLDAATANIDADAKEGKHAITVVEVRPVDAAPKKGSHFREFVQYFSEWRHMKILMGTCMCWFLVDIAFYGINLNTNVVLQEIGFAGKTGTAWEKLYNIAVGNLIITALGFVPGYWVTILTVEYLGRKWIQVQGFLMAALFLAILAGRFNSLSTPAFIVCFSLLQFFFNFGANTTTFMYPAEVFPSRFRATAHGMSAASGKVGAIISALAFNALSAKVGTPIVLWIFFACCIVGAGFTFLLPEVKGRDPDEIDERELMELRGRGY